MLCSYWFLWTILLRGILSQETIAIDKNCNNGCAFTSVDQLLRRIDEQEKMITSLQQSVAKLQQQQHSDEVISTSCKHMLSNNSSVSGEYWLKTKSGRTIKVYCEMGLNGGGYTFINVQSMATLTNDDVQDMFTDNSTFLLRIRKQDGTQPYAVLSQLPKFRSLSLKVQKDGVPPTFPGPGNVGYVGGTFLYFAFMSSSPLQDTQLGIQVNGVDVTYTHCDDTMASYFAFFPDYNERVPYDYATAAHLILNRDSFPFLTSIFDNARRNPSTRNLPEDYFTLMETHFGGCGVYTDTFHLHDLGYPEITGLAMGFR